MAHLHAVVERHMKARGMSLRGLAQAVHHDPSYLSKALRGIKPLGPALARDIDLALDADGEIIATSRAVGQPADAEKVRRSIEDALADGMMSASLLDDWDESVAAYGYRTRDTPAPLLLADLTADLAELRLAMGRHRSASALPRLTLAAARMSGLVCLTLIKAGDRQAWRRWGRTARHAASEAGDLPSLAWATAQEAYGYYYAGDMPGAVACAQGALSTARTPCVGGVLAAALEMRAHAAMGDSPATMRALGTAEQIHARLSGAALAASAFGYAESQLRFHAGDALTRLGDTTAARAELDRALALCPPEDYTDWALIRLNRAACMIGDGEADGGLAEAADALLALDGPRRQGIITSRGRELFAALTPAHRSSRAAREFSALLDDTPGMKEIPA